MHTGNSIIIHPSAIVQQGLKAIVLSQGISILDMLHAFPDSAAISGWKGLLILSDVQHSHLFKPFARTLGKNGNALVGIDYSGSLVSRGTVFTNVIYLDSTMDTILHILQEYLSGISEGRSDNQLSGRETEVLTMVAQGFSNKQIAGKLFISIHTVIAHRKNITSKLGIKSISGLTLYAALNNLVDFQR